jgi:ATP-dependent DNA helicase RecG
MTVYGDLDQTVLDELPVGRTPVTTAWLNGPEEYPAAWDKVREEVAAGRQAYVICPLVGGGQPEDEEPEELGEDVEPDDGGDGAYGDAGGDGAYGGDGDEPQPPAGPGRGSKAVARVVTLPLVGVDLQVEQRDKPPPKSAVEEFARLSSGELAGIAVGLLHGQLPSKEKEATMAAFRRGEIQVLVATTVIEVGVDVANATVMLVENAERFGLSQLHQLRGRIGRGEHPSTCLLMESHPTPPGARRLRAMVEHTDGFRLAEIDLELRSEGELVGTRQSGLRQFEIACMPEDAALLERARARAESIVAAVPELREPEHALLGQALERAFGAGSSEPIPA